AVDLDARQRPAGELQLALLHQPLGIEDPAPRLERPAADAYPDRTCHDVLLCVALIAAFPGREKKTSQAGAGGWRIKTDRRYAHDAFSTGEKRMFGWMMAT